MIHKIVHRASRSNSGGGEAMNLSNLKPRQGREDGTASASGRGPGSGCGKTAGRGSKGAARRAAATRASAASRAARCRCIRRMPKRGFTNLFRDEYRRRQPGRPGQASARTEIGDPRRCAEQRASSTRRRDRVKVLGAGRPGRRPRPSGPTSSPPRPSRRSRPTGGREPSSSGKANARQHPQHLQHPRAAQAGRSSPSLPARGLPHRQPHPRRRA
ncbi:MAG: uL15 family ribosomal protein [Candidatus Moduliflexus flocculans]|nr:uL15 family ribosomal protein [Candidatus Moduliflexus flocculans]